MAPQGGGNIVPDAYEWPGALWKAPPRPPGNVARQAQRRAAWGEGGALAGAAALWGDALSSAGRSQGKRLRRQYEQSPAPVEGNDEVSKATRRKAHRAEVAGATQRISTVAGVASIVGGVSILGAMAATSTKGSGSTVEIRKKRNLAERGSGGGGGAATLSDGAAHSDGLVDKRTGPALLLLLAVLYGGNVPLLKSIEDIAPLSLTAPELLTLRFLMATVLALPFLATHRSRVRIALSPALELSVWLWIGYFLQILALEKTSASITSVGVACTGVIVQLLELYFDRKPISPVVAVFSAGTLAGVAAFVTSPGGGSDPGSGPFRPLVDRMLNMYPILAPAKLPHAVVLDGVPGEVLCVGGAFFFAVHVWRSNKIVVQSAKPEVRGPMSQDEYCLALSALQVVVVMCLCMVTSYFDSPYSLNEQVSVLQRIDFAMWLQIAACGMLCTALPAVLELFAFKVVDPAVASLIYSTIPLWGTCLGVVFLHDAFGTQSICAGIVILVCSLAPSAIDILSKQKEVIDGLSD